MRLHMVEVDLKIADKLSDQDWGLSNRKVRNHNVSRDAERYKPASELFLRQTLA